jgi:hypothetical protein
LNTISGRRIIPLETQEPPAEADMATILYNQLLIFNNAIAQDTVIFPNPIVPARHVFFKERAFAFGLYLITCCFGNIDLGTEIIDLHRGKLSETKIQSQVDTYMADLLRTFQAYKTADTKVRKKHRFDNTAALDSMIPYLLGELNAEKSLNGMLAIREYIFNFIDELNSHQI